MIVNLIIITGLLFHTTFSFSQAFEHPPFKSDFYGQVIAIKGQGSLDGKTMHLNSVLSEEGTIQTNAQSYLKIFEPDTMTITIIGPSSKLKISKNKVNKEKFKLRRKNKIHFRQYDMEKGIIRFITAKKRNFDQKLIVQTLNATIGVKGTDFLIIVNDVFQETEVIVFSGKVILIPNKYPEKKIRISAKKWYGIGGRFKNSKVKTLNEKILNHYLQMNLETQIKNTSPSSKLYGHKIPIE